LIAGEIKSQIEKLWDAFWTGRISNPLEVIEQITYLLFIKRFDDLHTLEENKANRTKKLMERRIFPEGKRAELLPAGKQGPAPTMKLTRDEHAQNNLPDILKRWRMRGKSERKNKRIAQSF
jgi:hypothetical protein